MLLSSSLSHLQVLVFFFLVRSTFLCRTRKRLQFAESNSVAKRNVVLTQWLRENSVQLSGTITNCQLQVIPSTHMLTIVYCGTEGRRRIGLSEHYSKVRSAVWCCNLVNSEMFLRCYFCGALAFWNKLHTLNKEKENIRAFDQRKWK